CRRSQRGTAHGPGPATRTSPARRSPAHAQRLAAPSEPTEIASAVDPGTRGGGKVATIVIVDGWWSGGWYFQTTARKLRASGHEVYTPTVTGVGERVHLASPEITLETHVQDI